LSWRCSSRSTRNDRSCSNERNNCASWKSVWSRLNAKDMVVLEGEACRVATVAHRQPCGSLLRLPVTAQNVAHSQSAQLLFQLVVHRLQTVQLDSIIAVAAPGPVESADVCSCHRSPSCPASYGLCPHAELSSSFVSGLSPLMRCGKDLQQAIIAPSSTFLWPTILFAS
jgi:hypothetical protein